MISEKESVASAAWLFCFNSSTLHEKTSFEISLSSPRYKGSQAGRIKTPRLQMTNLRWDTQYTDLFKLKSCMDEKNQKRIH